MRLLKRINYLKENLQKNKPLIHCITHPIAINQCANIVLASGAKPIMAEHPDEVAEITENAKALYLSLGNINESRLEAIKRSLQVANKNGIPVILDLVGVGISTLRYNFALDCLRNHKITVAKGNMSEIKAMLAIKSDAIGVDVGDGDRIENNLNLSIKLIKDFAIKFNLIAFATGKIDIVSDGKKAFLCYNGHPNMADITASGCMLSALTASFMSVGEPFESASFATLLMGVFGQEAFSKENIFMDFYKEIIDRIYYFNPDVIEEKTNYKLIDL